MYQNTIRVVAMAAVLCAASMGGALAQDAMSSNSMMSTGGMGTDAMAPMMSDDDLALCVEQAKAITFSQVAMAAEQACHDMHNGHGGAMGGDAMMSTDAMSPQ